MVTTLQICRVNESLHLNLHTILAMDSVYAHSINTLKLFLSAVVWLGAPLSSNLEKAL